MSTRVLVGDAREVLKTLPSESVHMCVTSPPYYGLRDYGTADWAGGDASHEHRGMVERTVSGGDGKQYTNVGSNRVFSGDCSCGATRTDRQMGLEATPAEWVEGMVGVFREVRRVLRKDGTLWLNIGDSYAGSGRGDTYSGFNARYFGHDFVSGKQNATAANLPRHKPIAHGLKPKDLIGIPWMLAFALRADGWYLRADIIWNKPNPMPESVTDRPTKAHEYLFLLSKSRTYYYDADAIREEHSPASIDRSRYDRKIDKTNKGEPTGHDRIDGGLIHANGLNALPYTLSEGGRNKRSVWTVATEAFPESHFATYPTALIEPCIKAGTSEKGCCPECGAPWVRVVERGDLVPEYKTVGWWPSCAHPDLQPVPATVLDPFFGAGTTGLVADRLGRNCIGIELNPAYAEMARRRIAGESPMFAEVSVA